MQLGYQMSRSVIFRFAGLAVLFLIAGHVGPVHAETLSADQVQKELVGKSLGYSGAFSGNIVYQRGGKIAYTAKGKKFSGEWKLKNNKMCTRLHTNVREGKWSCFTFSRTGKSTYKTSLGYKVWKK